MSSEFEFICALPNGLHARPASHLAERARRFASGIVLTNLRTGGKANAKSILAIIAAEILAGDCCRVQVDGADEEEAAGALRRFIDQDLPDHDAPLQSPVATDGTSALPPSLSELCPQYELGIGISCGVAQGALVLLGARTLPPVNTLPPAATPQQEQTLFASAVQSVQAHLRQDVRHAANPDQRGVLNAHLEILADDDFRERITGVISANQSAACAIVTVGSHYIDLLRAASTRYTSQRAGDVLDLCLQLLEQIPGIHLSAPTPTLSEPAVVVAEDLSPRDLLGFGRTQLRGLVLGTGTTTSHTAILARSFGIPTIALSADSRRGLVGGQCAILDGELGVLITHPTPEVCDYYARESAALVARRARLAILSHKPGLTQDNVAIEIAANVTSADEVAPAVEQGAQAIGLFRTEMLFLEPAEAPSEQEQFEVYRRAATAARGPITIRTLDAGADKPVACLQLPAEPNPALGYRGVRIYRQFEQLFRNQLRAICRASAFGKVRLMVPMVSCAEEMQYVRCLVKQVQEQLSEEHIGFDPAMPIGAMIEIPSCAWTMRELCAQCDFFSIGTNDLSQYFWAADRQNARVAASALLLHPAFLRLLREIVTAAHQYNRPIGICGEMASQRRCLPLLVGLGLDELSMRADAVGQIKAELCTLSAATCRQILEEILNTCGDQPEVASHLQRRLAGTTQQRSPVDSRLIVLDAHAATKAQVIRLLVNTCFAQGYSSERMQLEQDIWAREAVYSTGLGYGFAIPHCKSASVDANCIAVARLAEPVEWGASDGQKVGLVILLAMQNSPGAGNAHMKVFARLARKLVHEPFRQSMLSVQTPEQIAEYLEQELSE